MYEDSIQELNNLIGELDSFQREHEMKMKLKQREKPSIQKPPRRQPNGHDVHNTTGDSTMTVSSIGDMSDIYNNMDKLSISSNDPNPLLCSTATHSSDLTFGSDVGLNDLTDCQATTRSLKLNLSTTEHPLVMHTSTNSLGGVNGMSDSISLNGSSLNGSSAVRSIELIPDSYNVSDAYVKEHTEVVVLRRKDSQNDVNTEPTHLPNGSANTSAKDVERISSFRCSSFAKTESPNEGKSTLQRGQSITSADSAGHRYNGNTNGMPVMQYDHDVVDHADNDTTQMIRQKPLITPRPASLSGLSFF